MVEGPAALPVFAPNTNAVVLLRAEDDWVSIAKLTQPRMIVKRSNYDYWLVVSVGVIKHFLLTTAVLFIYLVSPCISVEHLPPRFDATFACALPRFLQVRTV